MNVAKYQDLFMLFKLQAIIFLQNISAFNIVSGKSFNILLTNNYVSFEQLGPDRYILKQGFRFHKCRKAF